MIAGNIVVRIGADLSGFSEGLKKAGKEMKAASKELTSMGKNLTMGVTAPIVGAGAAAFQMAADMQDAIGATNQIFGDQGDAMQTWAKSLKSYYGIASGEALQYGNMMGAMLQNIGGLSEEEAAKQAQTLVGLAGDLTAMFGGTTESAVQALTGALKGNTSMLDNYGMAVNEATIKAKALEMGLITEGQTMDLATKQAATLALITEQSAAAQGQAAREAEGASGSMRAMMTEVKNLGASIGEILLPIFTPLLQKINEGVQWFGQLDQKTKEQIVTFALFAAAIGPVLLVLGSLLGAVTNVITFGKTLTTVFTGIKALFSILPAIFTLLTGPLGLVVLGVGALIAAGVLLYKNWDTIKEKAAALWTSLKETFASIGEFITGVWDGIVETITGAIDKITGAIDKVKSAFSSMPSGDSLGVRGGFYPIPKMASGGIVNSPTIAMIGEAGPEAVIPIDQLSSILQTLGGNSNKTQTINLTVELDGRVVARQTYEHLQRESKIRGTQLATAW